MLIKELKNAMLQLAFPHLCEGCGTDALSHDQFLCLRCLSSLPVTNFHLHPNNPVEKLFWGRLPVTHACAQFYFTKESMMQRLMHQFKYRNNRDLGSFLGRLMGMALSETDRFSSIDAFIPLPLFAAKERSRGFNQAAVLCGGMAAVLKKPVLGNVAVRPSPTETQTRKGRIERWLNTEGKFELRNRESIEGRHVLLVDDVVTTGATLEACGRELLKTKDLRLSIAALCFSSH